VRSVFRQRVGPVCSNKKEIAQEGNLFRGKKWGAADLGSSVACLRENSAAVQCVVDDLTNSGGFGIDVHTVTRFEMSDNAFCGDLKRNSRQLGIASRLDMINSQQPLIQRQMCIKSHDYVKSSKIEFLFFLYNFQMLSKPAWMQPSPLGKTQGFRVEEPQKQKLAVTNCRRGCSAKRGIIRDEGTSVYHFFILENVQFCGRVRGIDKWLQPNRLGVELNDEDAAQDRKALGAASLDKK
jgi:hypothetical protein